MSAAPHSLLIVVLLSSCRITVEDLNAVADPSPEVCDGVDNDLDGDIDEEASDAPTWYADDDGDGYGDPGTTEVSCEAPVGYIARGEDCDDLNASVNPEKTWHADDDGDGYGDAGNTLNACEQPAGYVEDSTDCDDATSTIHPNATEVCNGADDDCSGEIDESTASNAAVWYYDADQDSYGDINISQVACQQPSGYVDNNTDCNDADASVSPETIWYDDGDGDGYGDPEDAEVACQTSDDHVRDSSDCDDTDASVSPEAQELCDDIDNNCDGTVDEDSALDALIWYADDDEDGFGDAADTTTSCTQPSGYLSDSTDCDDANNTIHPGADELCDHYTVDADNDCDGAINEDDAVDAETWYTDSDGDGYGDPDTTTTACTQPSGYLSDASDCDDTDSNISPAATEIAGDEVDQDCDGTEVCYQDDDDDGYRPDATSTVASADTDCQDTGEAISTADTTDCDDSDASTNPGADERCDGHDDDCDGDIDEDDAVDADTWYLDDDGDGYGDPDAHTLCCEQPSGYVADSTDCDDTDADISRDQVESCYDEIDNNCNGLLDECLQGEFSVAESDATLTGESSGDQAGYSISGAGDVDGDGLNDLLIGAWGESSSGTEAGAAYLVLGPVTGEVSLSDADAILLGEDSNDLAGYSVSGAGDINGDGLDDLLIGAPYSDPDSRASAGTAYLVLGPVTGEVSLSDADAALLGESKGDDAGLAVSEAGDIDGDGLDDLLIGAPFSDPGGRTSAGTAYLVMGSLSGLSGEVELSDARTRFIGELYSGGAGDALAGAGDVDGDGLDDLLIGAPRDDSGGSQAGIAYVILGAVSGEVDLSDADARLIGESSSHFAGDAVSGAGDVDGDGYSDLLIGAYGWAEGSDSWTGAAYLLHGPVTGDIDLSDADAQLTGESSSDFAGCDVDSAGDVNRDGHSDLLIGAYQEDSGETNAGAAYLVLGPVSGQVSLSDADARFIGEGTTDYAGFAVAGVGDVDGDELNDLLIGAYYAGSEGSAYLFSGGREP